MIKAVIFDFDGVIIESADIKTNAFRKLFERDYSGKLDIIVGYHLQNMGISRYIKFRHIYKNILGLPLPRDLEEELGRKFSRIALREVLKAPFVPGAAKFLRSNYKKYALFVASGTPHDELCYIIKKRGLLKFFSEVRGSPPGKNEIISEILGRYALSPNQAVFVGDAQSDLSAAQQAGLYFIGRSNNSGDTFSKCIRQINDLSKLALSLASI